MFSCPVGNQTEACEYIVTNLNRWEQIKNGVNSLLDT